MGPMPIVLIPGGGVIPGCIGGGTGMPYAASLTSSLPLSLPESSSSSTTCAPRPRPAHGSPPPLPRPEARDEGPVLPPPSLEVFQPRE